MYASQEARAIAAMIEFVCLSYLASQFIPCLNTINYSLVVDLYLDGLCIKSPNCYELCILHISILAIIH